MSPHLRTLAELISFVNPYRAMRAFVGLTTAPAEQIVVSFRGTESEYLKDIITDVRVLREEITAPADSNDADVKIDGGLRVHRGFLAAVRSVAPKVKELLALAIPSEEASGWTVSVTGHSMGAALATLFAYDLKTDPDWCALALACL